MSLQQIITKFIFKLPDGLLVRMAGGKPVEVRGRVLEPQLQMVAWNGRNAPPMSSLEPEIVQAAVFPGLLGVADVRLLIRQRQRGLHPG